MVRWDFWKRDSSRNSKSAAEAASADRELSFSASPEAEIGESTDEWSFLRTQPDHDADEMASVHQRSVSDAAPTPATPPAQKDRASFRSEPARPAQKSQTRRVNGRSEKTETEARLVLEMEVDGIRMLQTLTAAAILGRSDAESGSTPDVDFAPDDSVSRRHARVALREGFWVLRDLGSLNGTRHNGRDVEPGTDVMLRDGDQLTLGESRLTVRSTGANALSDEDRSLNEMLETLGVAGVDPRQFFDEIWDQPVESVGADLLDVALECGVEAGLLGTGNADRPNGDRTLEMRNEPRGEMTRELTSSTRRGG